MKERIKYLNDKKVNVKGKYVAYWIQASQRTKYNHALELAIQKANQEQIPLFCFFGLTKYPAANQRPYHFMLEGLQYNRQKKQFDYNQKLILPIEKYYLEQLNNLLMIWLSLLLKMLNYLQQIVVISKSKNNGEKKQQTLLIVNLYKQKQMYWYQLNKQVKKRNGQQKQLDQKSNLLQNILLKNQMRKLQSKKWINYHSKSMISPISRKLQMIQELIKVFLLFNNLKEVKQKHKLDQKNFQIKNQKIILKTEMIHPIMQLLIYHLIYILE